MVPDFDQTLQTIDPKPPRLDNLGMLQINLGNRCNQACVHCHVQAGPTGQKIMPRQVMQQITGFLRNHPGLCIDVTGGCPELNPDYTFFLENIQPLASPLMVRTNFTVFFEPGLEWIPEWYRNHNVIIIGSLPCYTQDNVDKQRGQDVFGRSIEAIKLLNDLGYGRKHNLQLNLVYNPGADFLPASQQQLEADYKKQLLEDYNISFDSLFTITNAPIGRFKQYLEANGLLDKYLELLAENFNPDAVQNIMCRNLISVDYRGILYNCDFNQALDLAIIDKAGQIATIDQLENILSQKVQIITGQHCFCCTAGAGSSCTGSLTK
jgi:radical SAM/Cys-rich protein